MSGNTNSAKLLADGATLKAVNGKSTASHLEADPEQKQLLLDVDAMEPLPSTTTTRIDLSQADGLVVDEDLQKLVRGDGLVIKHSSSHADLLLQEVLRVEDLQKVTSGDSGAETEDTMDAMGAGSPSKDEHDEIIVDSKNYLPCLGFLKVRCLLYPFLLVAFVILVAIFVAEATKKHDMRSIVPTNLGNGTPPATFPPTKFTPPPSTDCRASEGVLEIGDYLFDQNSAGAPSVDLTLYNTTYDNEDCDIGFDSADAPGLWYTVIGTGGRLMVSICADFDHRITVLDGTDCSESDHCIAHSGRLPSSMCFGGTGLQWDSELGRVYYVAVHGDEYDWSDSGSFDMRFGKVAENDICERAPMLSLGSAVQGDTTFASYVEGDSYDEGPNYPSAETCLDTGVVNQDYQYRHEGFSVQGSGGIWYKVQRHSDQPLRATTSCKGNDQDDGFIGTQIVVFSGSCATLQCVGTSIDITQNDPDLSCSENSVSWLAKAGETYLIHVHGAGYADFTVGKFFLLITEEPGNVETDPPMPDPTNSMCADAIGPLVVGESVQGATGGALNAQAPQCGGATEQLGSGVWYLVKGTGQAMILSTCPPEGEYWQENDFHKQISLFEGSCDGLVCIDGGSYVSHRDHSTCFGSAGVSWDTVEGKDYYVLIHGEYIGSSGNFNLYLDVAPPNYQCDFSTPLNLGNMVEGTTLYGDQQNIAECGDASSQNSNGAWYTIINEESVAKRFIATTCTLGEESSINVQVSVFRGDDCNSLLCVDGSNSTDPEGICFLKEAGVAWLAEPNEVYHILVHHEEWDDVGTFSLEVRETELAVEASRPSPPNDMCSGAIELPHDGTFIDGTTEGADYDRDVDQDIESPGVWYRLVGRGESERITVKNADDGPSFTFEVYKSGAAFCNDLAAIEYDYYDGFEAEEGVVYYILIHSWQSMTVGNFSIGLFL